MTVAIIVANRNYGRWIDQFRQSLRAQQFEDWHLFIVDYGSTDASEFHYQALQGEFPGRFTPITLERPVEKVHPLEAQNRGIREAVLMDCEYIMGFGIDDVMQPGLLWELHEMLQDDSSLKLAWSSFHACDEGGVAIGKAPTLADWWERIPKECAIPEPALIRTSALQEAGCLYYEWQLLSVMASFDRYLKLFHHFGTPDIARFIDEPLFLYRQHKEQMSAWLMTSDLRERELVVQRYWDRFEGEEADS